MEKSPGLAGAADVVCWRVDFVNFSEPEPGWLLPDASDQTLGGLQAPGAAGLSEEVFPERVALLRMQILGARRVSLHICKLRAVWRNPCCSGLTHG